MGDRAASIRTLFLMPSLIAILVMTGSAVAHLLMVDLATHSASQAREYQQRSAAYIRLKIAARRLPLATLATRQSAILGLDYSDARRDFSAILSEIARLPPYGSSERQTASTMILRLGAETVRLTDFLDANRSTVLAQLDSEEHRNVLNMQTLRKQLRPLIELDELLDQEIAAAGNVSKSDRTARLSWTLASASILGMATGIALMSLASALVLRRLQTGLRGLEAGARAIKSVDFSYRVEISGKDELAQIGATLNAIADQLQHKQRLVERSRANLQAIIDRKTRDLEIANRILAEADERRRTFFSDIGHELRIPLTIIRGEAQVWLRSKKASGQSNPEEVFSRIIDAATSLQKLVDDLFVIARAGSGDLALEVRQFDLHELATGTVARFAVIARERGCQVSMQGVGPIAITADPDRLRQALSILLDNASKHGGAGVEIQVEVAREHNDVTVSVSDNGRGVAPHLRDHIFSRSFSAGPRKGTGLGLSVAQAIAAAHGGKLSLSPQGSEPGASFTMRLPHSSPKDNEP